MVLLNVYLSSVGFLLVQAHVVLISFSNLSTYQISLPIPLNILNGNRRQQEPHRRKLRCTSLLTLKAVLFILFFFLMGSLNMCVCACVCIGGWRGWEVRKVCNQVYLKAFFTPTQHLSWTWEESKITFIGILYIDYLIFIRKPLVVLTMYSLLHRLCRGLFWRVLSKTSNPFWAHMFTFYSFPEMFS